MTNHQLDELLEGGGLRVPAEFGLGFGRVAPEVDNVGRAVEVFGIIYRNDRGKNRQTLEELEIDQENRREIIESLTVEA